MTDEDGHETHEYYKGCVLDDGDYVDYGLNHFDWPSRGWWLIPGTWRDE